MGFIDDLNDRISVGEFERVSVGRKHIGAGDGHTDANLLGSKNNGIDGEVVGKSDGARLGDSVGSDGVTMEGIEVGRSVGTFVDELKEYSVERLPKADTDGNSVAGKREDAFVGIAVDIGEGIYICDTV